MILQMIRPAKALAAILLVLLLVPSCSTDPKVAIIGKWTDSTGRMAFEFFPDGTISTGFGVGKVSFPDQTHMKVELGGIIGGLGGTQLWPYSLNADGLAITIGPQEFSLHRVK
jgi:hypothetical protein